MIDLRRLREDAAYRAGAVRKGTAEDAIERLLAAEADRRLALREVEKLRALSNAASKKIGQVAPEGRAALIEGASAMKKALSDAELQLTVSQQRVAANILEIPNPADASVPSGGDEAFEIVAVVGAPTAPPVRDHADYGEWMGFVDSRRGSRTSGTRFVYLRKAAVLLELALVQWTVQTLVGHGFEPVIPPVLVREEMMVGAGFFPTDRNQVYEVSSDGLFLTGTSEIALAGLHRDERLASHDLPLRYAGFSSCFRREAGTHGKDTRGMFRVHQFDKVEMFSYVDAEESWTELERIRAIQEEIIAGLDLPYRVVNVAAGDLGAPAAKKYDCEVWLPSERRYRELTSCSNYTDYSARRLDTWVKAATGTVLPHTLNGTACAVGRTLLFLFEYYQEADGRLIVPEVLRPFCGFDEVPPPS